MKHSSTWDLLDLADDYSDIVRDLQPNTIPVILAKEKLASIDTELLSRMPQGEFVTLLGDNGNPVGFEPYIGEDNEYLSYLAFERHVTESLSKAWWEYDEDSA